MSDAEDKPTVYLETTFVSYLTARPSRDLVAAAHQHLTHEWWDTHRNRFQLYISQFVLDEAGRGDVQVAARRIQSKHPLLHSSLSRRDH